MTGRLTVNIGRTAILRARDEAGLELLNASEFVKSPRLLVKYQGLYQLIPRFWRKQAQVNELLALRNLFELDW
jgi:hypothetical protein